METPRITESSLSIREMVSKDWPQVKLIYEQGISTGFATFETKAPEWDQWNNSHLKFGRWIAESDNQVIGWVALSSVTDRCVYSGVAEVSVYVSADAKGRGVGHLLMQKVIADSESNGIWTLNAAMFPENSGSIRLHKKVGFREIGIREKIAKLDGKWRDNVVMERRSKTVGI